MPEIDHYGRPHDGSMDKRIHQQMNVERDRAALALATASILASEALLEVERLRGVIGNLYALRGENEHTLRTEIRKAFGAAKGRELPA